MLWLNLEICSGTPSLARLFSISILLVDARFHLGVIILCLDRAENVRIHAPRTQIQFLHFFELRAFCCTFLNEICTCVTCVCVCVCVCGCVDSNFCAFRISSAAHPNMCWVISGRFSRKADVNNEISVATAHKCSVRLKVQVLSHSI